MRFRSAVITLLLIMLAPTYASGGYLTLDEAWQLMQDYDPALKASSELLTEKKGDKMSALSAFLPQLGGDVSIRRYLKEEGFIWDSGNLGWGTLAFPATSKTVPQYSVNLEQLIFDSGKSIAGYKASTYGVEAARHVIFAERQGRAIFLVRAYSFFYLAKKRLEVAESAASALNEHARVARLRYEQNLVPRTDKLAAEVAASKARLDVIKARDHVDVAQKQLATLIGTAPGNVATPDVPYPPDYIPSPKERPEIKAKTAEMNAARYEAKKAKFSYLPEIYARVEAAYIDDSYRINKDQYTLWGGLHWPIFDGLLNWGQKNAATARARRNRWQRDTMENAFTVELEDARRAWERSDKEISVAKLNRSRASENLRDAKLAYSEGMISALDVRDAVKLWSEAAYGYHEAICSKEMAAARLRQAAGIAVLDYGGLDAE